VTRKVIAKGHMDLLTPGTHLVVYMKAKDPTPSQEVHSREVSRENRRGTFDPSTNKSIGKHRISEI
jgi:hypothetical protein